MDCRIALVQFAPVLGDKDANRVKINSLLNEINDVDVILFPELSNSGYNFNSQYQANGAAEEIDKSPLVFDLIEYAQVNDVAIAIGFAEKQNDKLYNSALWITPMGVEAVYRKLHLFARENLYFCKGDKPAPIVTWKGTRLGLMICYDWTFPEMWQLMAHSDVDVVCHLCNLVMPYAQEMVKTYAFSNHYYVAQINRIGTEADLTFTGKSSIISPTSEILCKASASETEIIVANIDKSMVRDKQLNPYNNKHWDTRNDFFELEWKDAIRQREDLKVEKRALRRYIRSYWNSLSKMEIIKQSETLLAKLERRPWFANAQNVLLFWSLSDEVYTHEFIRKYADKKNIYLPVMQGEDLIIAKYNSDAELLKDNKFGVYEPRLEEVVSVDQLDLILVPGLAFDIHGGRLGRGKGFYDRLLSSDTPMKVGLALPFQMVYSVPMEQHDQRLDKVLY